MNKQDVIELMKSSKSETDWNANCDKVKKACGGYPPFWYSTIISSGLAEKTLAKFGKSAELSVETLTDEEFKKIFR